MGEAGGQHRTDVFSNGRDLDCLEGAGPAEWIDSGSMEDLVCVDVSQTGQETLIEQQGFDGNGSSLHPRQELWRPGQRIESVGSELGN